MNIVKITASGKVGCGKSAVLGEIEIALKAIGLKVEWVEGAAEKGLTHADWIPELEMYQPTVVLSEKNDIAAPAAQGDAVDAINDELVAALKDITDDICERFDMESSSTNPGIKNCVERARAAISAKAAS